MIRRYFCERREAERRANVDASLTFHFTEIERRKRARRAADNRAICLWIDRFDRARLVQVDL